MYKATVEIARINSMIKIRFGLIIHSENEEKTGLQVVNKFSYYGNDYIRFRPNPFITFDLTSKINKKDGYNSNLSISFNRYALFRFIQGLRKMINDFRQYTNLFYYRGNELVVNETLIPKILLDVRSGNGKALIMRPCVVPDEENNEMVYEGCVMFINSMDNYAYITYTEMEYLLWELTNINMTDLSMLILSAVKDYESKKITHIPVPPRVESVDPVEVEIQTPSTFTKVEKHPVMPNI